MLPECVLLDRLGIRWIQGRTFPVRPTTGYLRGAHNEKPEHTDAGYSGCVKVTGTGKHSS